MMKNGQSLVYLVDDEENVVESLSEGLSREGFRIKSFTSAEAALQAVKAEIPTVVVTDVLMPDLDGIDLIKKMKRAAPEISFVVMTAHASVESAVQALRLGAIDYLVKPFRLNELISTVQKAMSQTRLVPLSGEKSEMAERYRLKNLISKDPRMIETFKMIGKIAPTDTTVLIMGESGTGKEMLARSVHYNSKRKSNPFVSVNCAALPETLLESELFGFEKGAFTGAAQTKQGLFEVANGGTFFLDEIGEIPLSLQAKLLRVIQERVVTHLGGVREIPINVRLIAATSRNLPAEMKEGRFREDLYYRLHVVPVVLSPLRERPNDILPLTEYFLQVYEQKHHVKKGHQIDEKGMAYLKNYAWPGNIRELENLMERIVVLHEDSAIGVSVLESLIGKTAGHSKLPAGAQTALQVIDLNTAVENFEKQMIVEALSKSKGNKFQAARELGLTRQNLRYKLQKYGIN